ncbi:MAG: hypothetical protein QXV83_03790 [Candidatus Anstonellaceae archaeon]
MAKFFSLFIFFLFLCLSISFAALPDLSTQIKSFCADIYSLLPPISMLLVIAAAVTYAAGQLASAEMRARATGWATAMIVGALFGFVLVSLIPPIISTLYNANDWTAYCSK